MKKLVSTIVIACAILGGIAATLAIYDWVEYRYLHSDHQNTSVNSQLIILALSHKHVFKNKSYIIQI